jgi:hypothetical protein
MRQSVCTYTDDLLLACLTPSDMSPEVHCNLCNHCYTLGMPDPRLDIRCVQYLPKVHHKVPNKFLAPSGTSEVID